MPGTQGINSSQPFKLTIESFRASRPANGNARANAPQALANAQAAAAPQPAVAHAQQPKKGLFAWIKSWFTRAEPAPAPAPRVSVPPAAQVPPHRQFNNDIYNNISGDDFNGLPQEFKNALNALASQLRDKFGEEMVPRDANVCQFLRPVKGGKTSIEGFVERANAAGRPITPDEVVQEFANRAQEQLVGKMMGTRLLECATKAGVSLKGMGTALALGLAMRSFHSELAAEIDACAKFDDVIHVLDSNEEKFMAFLNSAKSVNEQKNAMYDNAARKLSDATGLNKDFLLSIIDFTSLKDKASSLANNILGGKLEGCKAPDFDIKKEFESLVDKFVNERIDYLAKIDELDVSDSVKQNMKATALGSHKMPPLSPAQILDMANAIDIAKFKSAIANGVPSAVKCDLLESVQDKMLDVARNALGPKFSQAGADEISSLTNLAQEIVFSKDPAMKTAAHSALNTLLGEVSLIASKDNRSNAATFIAALSMTTENDKNKSLLPERQIDEAVKKQCEEAFAEGGVTNAKIISDLKSLFLEGCRSLNNGGRLEDISAFIASIKERVPTLAKALGSIAERRANALDVAATNVAAGTGISKAHILANLDVSTIASDSGKLRFLYMDVLSAAKKGKGVNAEEVAAKADEILAKFAQAKTDLLNNINQAGFGPVDHAKYSKMALTDSGWTDPALVSVAKDLSENASIKNAYKVLANVLKPSAAATLDAKEIGTAFSVFAKSFSQAILTGHAETARKLAESSDAQQRMQMMVLSLLAKEEPEIPVFLAKLSGNGKLDEIRSFMSDEMNRLRSLKMDYMTLEQQGLLGAPNNEAIRSVLSNPNLQYDAQKFAQIADDDAALNVANTFLGSMTADLPTSGRLADVDRFVANKVIGEKMVEKHCGGLPPETVPILKNLVGLLDWRPDSVQESEEIVKNFAEDLKVWRDITPGSQESKGLEDVMLGRMNEYMTDVLKGVVSNDGFQNVGGTSVFATFFKDLTRNKFILNGSTLQGENAGQMLDKFKSALRDPAKLKTVSVMMNQQIFGELTTSVPNKLPLAAWKGNQPEKSLSDIPHIEKFASRAIEKSGCPLFDSGSMTFEIDVAPDGNSAKIRAKTESPIRAGSTMMDKNIGKCIISQEFTLEFGNEPVIKDLKIGQTFA